MNALPISLLLLMAGVASAAQVSFSSASTTFDQGGSFAIASAINGSTTDGLGWGVFGGQNTAQTSIFRTSGTVTSGELGFTLPWLYGTSHYGQSFRISTTTDANPAAGGNWTPISPSVFRATGGGVLTGGAGNILNLTSAPTAPATATSFFVTTAGAFANVTGFRLEMFTGGNGFLGASANGNFVLTEFQVDTTNNINRALGATVTSSAATYAGQPASNLTDGLLNTNSHPGDNLQNNFAYTLDMGAIISLTRLELFNRTDGCCPDRLSNYRVQILDGSQSSVWSGDIRTDGSNSGVSGLDTITSAMGSGAFAGRYVRITNLGGGAYNPQLAEIKAFGTLVPEPGTGALAIMAALGFTRRRRRRDPV